MQREFARELGANGGDSTEAAISAGYGSTYQAAAKQGKVNLENPKVQKLIREYLDAADVTDERIAARVSEGLDAMEAKTFVIDGQIVTAAPVVDFGERRKYIELACKMKGHLTDVSSGATQVTVFVHAPAGTTTIEKYRITAEEANGEEE